jgi:regulator of cell morphogenesis and NO signaling
MIHKNMPMCQAVLEHNQLLPLLPRFSIKLGFGEKNVEEVCRLNGVNADFFLEIANAYLDDDYIPQIDLFSFPLGAMVAYLTSTHDYYITVALPKIEHKIHLLLEGSTLSEKERGLVSNFFNDYRKEFMDHISREEERVLPYILELEKQCLKEEPDKTFITRLQHNSIKVFAQEHDRLENSLENLSRLIIKYLPPFEDFDLCYQVLSDLSDLVRDLIDHAHMEDKVLIPRVAELEQQLIQKLDAG